MIYTIFNPDFYEKDLALIMLETLVKKKEISFDTYKAAKKKVKKEDEYDESCNDGTAKTID